ncbi:MAG: hypothetical protein ACOY0T_15775 [Myxococcota bacterium]
MQLNSHAFVIYAAVAASGRSWLGEYLSEILSGAYEEDGWRLGPLRLPAPGLTHTYRPGYSRGELGAPSARTCLLRHIERSRASTEHREAAHWLGRACHLLADMAVPARTRGVWHLFGDPLESWLERNHRELPKLLADYPKLPAELPTPAELADSLANASSRFAADTTRTPWGALAYRWFKSGLKLEEAEVVAQARSLIPVAVEHTFLLLEGEVKRRGVD